MGAIRPMALSFLAANSSLRLPMCPSCKCTHLPPPQPPNKLAEVVPGLYVQELVGSSLQGVHQGQGEALQPGCTHVQDQEEAKDREAPQWIGPKNCPRAVLDRQPPDWRDPHHRATQRCSQGGRGGSGQTPASPSLQGKKEVKVEVEATAEVSVSSQDNGTKDIDPGSNPFGVWMTTRPPPVPSANLHSHLGSPGRRGERADTGRRQSSPPPPPRQEPRPPP